MVNVTLQAQPALGNYSFSLSGFSVTERTSAKLMSISFSLAEYSGVKDVIAECLSLQPPDIGQSTSTLANQPSHDDTSAVQHTLLGMQQDQYWWLGQCSDADYAAVYKKLDAKPLRLTDQSDAWVLLELQGPRRRDVLERLCPLDINERVFANKRVARTTIEHMSTVLYRPSQDRFLILTPRSSGRSFVHALEHTAAHVLNETSVRRNAE